MPGKVSLLRNSITALVENMIRLAVARLCYALFLKYKHECPENGKKVCLCVSRRLLVL